MLRPTAESSIAEEEAEEGVGDVGAVVDQEHQEAVGQREGVLPPAARLPLAPGPVLAAGIGLLVAGCELVEQAVEGSRGDPGQMAEGLRGRFASGRCGSSRQLQTRRLIVQ